MLTKEEIYKYAIDGLAEHVSRMKHLSALSYGRGDIEGSEKYDKKRYEYSDKISWLESELQKGV